MRPLCFRSQRESPNNSVDRNVSNTLSLEHWTCVKCHHSRVFFPPSINTACSWSVSSQFYSFQSSVWPCFMCTWSLLAELRTNKSLENTLRLITLSVVAVVIIFVKFYVVLATPGNPSSVLVTWILSSVHVVSRSFILTDWPITHPRSHSLLLSAHTLTHSGVEFDTNPKVEIWQFTWKPLPMDHQRQPVFEFTSMNQREKLLSNQTVLRQCTVKNSPK